MYSFDIVIQELNFAISLKTLKNWANKVEKVTDTKFVRQYAKNAGGRNYGYKVFSFDQIGQFKQLVSLRKEKVSLNEAILMVFMSEEEKEQNETIEVRKKEFNELRNDAKQLIELSRKVLEDNGNLRNELSELKADNRIK